jgi:hypothetical protein
MGSQNVAPRASARTETRKERRLDMHLDSSLKATLVATLAFSQVACVASTLPKMQDDRPIDIDHGFFAVRYKQDGHPVDPSDMRDRLERSPESASDVKRAKVVGTLGVILAGIAGGLIGWPVGQKLAGEQHPLWPLAYTGAATFAVAIPFGIWSDSSLDSAVEKHNHHQAAPDSAEDLGPRRDSADIELSDHL